MIILASSSPRRKELLEQIGCKFVCETLEVKEIEKAPTVSELVKRNAFAKGFAVAKRHRDNFVIGADTVVAVDDKVLGKPKNKEEAIQMLTELSGRDHMVYTGVAIFLRDQSKLFVSKTKVKFAKMTEEEIKSYVDTNEPLDKAGGYAIQGIASTYITKIRGDYPTVVGLPIHRLYEEAKKLGVDITKD